MSQSTLDSEQVLKQLSGETDQAVENLKARAKDTVDINARFSELEREMDEAVKIRDARERELRIKVLSASLEELRKDAEKEEHDLAQAVFGLNAMLENMGKEYASLNKPSGEEMNMVKRAEERVEHAKRRLELAEQKRFFKQRAIDEAKLEITKAEQALHEARLEAKRKARHRLMTADFEVSLQEFMLRVEKTIDIMERRRLEIETQLRSVKVKKEASFKVKKQAAEALEELDAQLNEAETHLRGEEEHLESLVNGSPEHAKQTELISRLRSEVEDIRGRRNTALVLYQSKEKFAAELEIHERAQMKLRDNQRMWITALRSDTEERVVTFRSRLEAMKAMADQDIAKQIDTLGQELDQKNAEYMARAGTVSDDMRLRRMESHPDRVADIAIVRAAQAEAIQRIREREVRLIEQFKEQYGIDPTKSSFFNYESQPQEGSGTF
jgi:hypothetical protein